MSPLIGKSNLQGSGASFQPPGLLRVRPSVFVWLTGLAFATSASCSSPQRKFDNTAKGGASGVGGTSTGGGAGASGSAGSSKGGVGGSSGSSEPGDMAGAAGDSGMPGDGMCKDTEYFDGKECTALTVCMANEYEAVPPAADRDRVCKVLTECTSEQYAVPSSGGKDNTCVALTVCGAGTYVSGAPTATTNRSCSPCAAGTFSSQPNTAACKAWKTCSSGETESVAPDLTSDRVCSPCGSGKYSLNGTCTPLTECASTEYESKAATATSDRVCKAISDCAPGSSQTAAPTKTTDRQCAPCGANSFSTTKNADSCTAWTACTSSQYETAAPSATTNRTCAALTSCTPGQRIKTAATATTNRVCEACPSGTFSTADNSASCQTWKTCGTGQGETTAGTSTTDRVCATCTAGTYSTGGKCVACGSNTFSSGTGATSCTACTSCGWFPGSACTATADASCTKQNTAKQEGTSGLDSSGGLVLDNSGNVWVAGTLKLDSKGDVVLYKYDPTGNKLKTINIATAGSERAYGLVKDTGGNIWVAGTTDGALTGTNPTSATMAFAARFAPDGTAKGIVQFSGSAGGMIAIGAGLSNDVWVTAGTFLTHIYDNGGTLTQTKPGDISTVSTSATGIQDSYGVTVDSNGSPWATGITDNGIYVFKGTPDGEVLNSDAKFVEFGPPPSQVGPQPLAIRAVGSNVWVLGKIGTRYDDTDSSVPSTGFGGRDGFIVRVTVADAKPHEVTQFGGLGNDYVNSTFVDSKGDLWVSGQSDYTFGGKTGQGGFDLFASRFTIPTSGKAVQTTETYLVGTPSQEYEGWAVLDAAQHLWIAGSTGGQMPGYTNLGGTDIFVMEVGK